MSYVTKLKRHEAQSVTIQRAANGFIVSASYRDIYGSEAPRDMIARDTSEALNFTYNFLNNPHVTESRDWEDEAR